MANDGSPSPNRSNQNELTLWWCHAREFSRSFSTQASTRWALVLLVTSVFTLLMIAFFLAGRVSTQFSDRTSWLTLGIGLSLASGFFTGIRPSIVRPSFLTLPISKRALVWDNLIRTFRYPIIIALVLTVPFYLGIASNGYYGAFDYLLIIFVLLLLLLSVHLCAVGIAQLVKGVTHHTFIRFLAIISLLVLASQFLVSDNVILAALERAFASVTTGEAALVILASIGLAGTAIVLVEYVPPTLKVQPSRHFWGILANNRNFRAVFGSGEATMVRSLLFALRNAKLHQQLATVFVLFTVFGWLSKQLVPDLTFVFFALFGIAVGLVAYYLSFEVGAQLEQHFQKHFYLPVNYKKAAVGAFIASAIVTFLIGLLLAQYLLDNITAEPWALVVLLSIIFFVHSLAFTIGRYAEDLRKEHSYLDEGYAIILIVAAAIFAGIAQMFVGPGNWVEAIFVTLCWGAAYSLGGWWLLRPTHR